jgi:hypothetical protein
VLVDDDGGLDVAALERDSMKSAWVLTAARLYWVPP